MILSWGREDGRHDGVAQPATDHGHTGYGVFPDFLCVFLFRWFKEGRIGSPPGENSTDLCELFADCCKPQPIRTHMRADDCGDIDHQYIARDGLAGFLH